MKTNLTGYDLLIHPRLNKGMAFTESERDAFGLHGLLPPHIGTIEQQRNRRKKGLDEETASVQKYSFMRDLQDTNETLFYSLITHYIEETLPIVYTPTVGEACQTNNSYIFPGLALGIISSKARRVSDAMIKAAALTLANLAPTRQRKEGNLLPPLANIRSVSLEIAKAVGNQAIQEGNALVDEAQFEQELAGNVWEPVYEPYERA